MTKLAEILGTVASGLLADRTFALVGGLAVSARTEPRFTRDIDLAIAVIDDAEAERIVFSMQRRGFLVVATVEHQTVRRLATARLRQSAHSPFVDLLFASSGIEPEIVAAATTLDVLTTAVPVATVGHLIAMKLLSRDSKSRPRDQQDLVELAAVADQIEWERAETAIDLILARGFARGRALRTDLDQLRAAK